MLDKERFFKGLEKLKCDYQIKLRGNINSGETNSRRIAISVTNLYSECLQDDIGLDYNITVGYIGFLERGIYEAVKKENFTCDMIDEEFRMNMANKELRRSRKKAKTGQLNPLKLAIEGEDRGYDNHLFIQKIIKILKEKFDGIENIPRCKTERFDNDNKFRKDVRSIQSNDFGMDAGQRSSIYKTR